jgi:hypothetical protein
MRRRDLITLLGGAAACGARNTRASLTSAARSVQRIRAFTRSPTSQNNVNHIFPYRRHT